MYLNSTGDFTVELARTLQFDEQSIPHNGNLSNGVMFATETLSGKRIDQDYARARARWEPLYEVTQMEGDGEEKRPEMLHQRYRRAAVDGLLAGSRF